jgi:peptidoglycan/LPS O-acetylase OafA/YrhL
MERSADRSRLVGIEGMRALAASSVLVYHVWLYGAPDGGAIDFGPASKFFANLLAGVTLFFVLSGFLLFRPYVAAALRGTPTPSLRGFLRNRALRIAPAYWVILAFVAVALDRRLLEAPQQLAANAFLVQDYVPGYIYGPGIVPAWSLAIEVVFYLSVPFLGAAAIRLARRGGVQPVAAAFVPVGAMVAIGLGSKLAERAFSLGEVWRLGFPAHADWFAAGMALAVLRVLWEDGRLRLPRYWHAGCAAGATALVAAALGLRYRGVLDGLEYQTLVAAACALLLAIVVLSPPTAAVVRMLDRRAFVAVGLASYSLFLWHDPLLRWLREEGLTVAGRGGFVVNLVIVAALSGVASTITYRWVERPALRRKRAWQRPAPAPPPARPEPVEVAVAPVASSVR